MLYNITTDHIIRQALQEDIGMGDMTTNSVVPFGKQANGRFMAKEKGVICGLSVVRRVFALLEPEIRFSPVCRDGDTVERGKVVAEVSGPAAAILTGERVALNFLQRLSGIATRTASFASMVAGTTTVITDTRKTTPGLRILEKYAVKTGGGTNHRMNLSDGILIKDNHIKVCGGITAAVESAKIHAPRNMTIEVEVESIEQVEEAVQSGADIIMLDNMDNETMAEAVKIINGRAQTEASGNMSGKDLLAVARTGVDMISIGGLTHSVRALDISLNLLFR